jgi:hypothetical protein
VTAQELAVLDEQRMQIRLGERAEPRRRTADIGLHNDRRPKGRHDFMPPNASLQLLPEAGVEHSKA